MQTAYAWGFGWLAGTMVGAGGGPRAILIGQLELKQAWARGPQGTLCRGCPAGTGKGKVGTGQEVQGIQCRGHLVGSLGLKQGT